MNNKKYKKSRMLCMDGVLIFLMIAFDQLTKYLAVSRLRGNQPFVLIEGVLELDYLENRGSAFGMLQNQKAFLLLIGLLFMGVILFLLLRLPEQKKFLIVHILLSCIIAGGVGNMADRFRLGYVVDFISFVLINYPIFNVADIYIVVSTIGLFVLFLFVFKDEDLEFLNFRRKQGKD